MDHLDLDDVLADFVELEGGRVDLRDDRIQAKWQVELKPFCLSKYPVTQALYHQVTGNNPARFTGANHPVEHVSWYDAVQFCNQISTHFDLRPVYQMGESKDHVTEDLLADGFRLPHDAEWQFAALGGQSSPLYGEIGEIAWFKGNSGGTTHEVGQKAPNAFGLRDMLGNVWEWCFDVYDPEVYGSYRIFRGGGWNDPERGCLATNRRRSHPTYDIDDLGFRLARTRR
ncbi:formylglycine-generating enzyme family protein [Maritalea myrionectae]|uniref:formylglycine-generating enzyme family protein n=1 Tax=Maritalea myrionectae TaxID=454601 RepID=UPI0004131619|nr:SUMF1/EgtB/PvdO family nonheme iron enzyme [Maritalea myrionectae]